MKFGRRQNKDNVRGRLFQGFEQRVKGAVGEHMHLVHDIHTVFQRRRGIYHLVADITDVFHAVVGRRIHFENVGRRTRIDGSASKALPTWISVLRVLTVYRFCQNFGTRGLSRPSRAAKKIGVAEGGGIHPVF